jgi:hypothetical protein
VRQRARHAIATVDAWPFFGRSKVVEVARPVLMPIVGRVRAWADPARRRSEPEA